LAEQMASTESLRSCESQAFLARTNRITHARSCERDEIGQRAIVCGEPTGECPILAYRRSFSFPAGPAIRALAPSLNPRRTGLARRKLPVSHAASLQRVRVPASSQPLDDKPGRQSGRHQAPAAAASSQPGSPMHDRPPEDPARLAGRCRILVERAGWLPASCVRLDWVVADDSLAAVLAGIRDCVRSGGFSTSIMPVGEPNGEPIVAGSGRPRATSVDCRRRSAPCQAMRSLAGRRPGTAS